MTLPYMLATHAAQHRAGAMGAGRSAKPLHWHMQRMQKALMQGVVEPAWQGRWAVLPRLWLPCDSGVPLGASPMAHPRP